jgi:hypothetical protein
LKRLINGKFIQEIYEILNEIQEKTLEKLEKERMFVFFTTIIF